MIENVLFWLFGLRLDRAPIVHHAAASLIRFLIFDTENWPFSKSFKQVRPLNAWPKLGDGKQLFSELEKDNSVIRGILYNTREGFFGGC